ncbi:NitT/TauT family transport system substrate-binding protein [Neorhizobium galegae]|uniref:ABC transporter substrate-binding protein n=1 Tax=Rhizobium/Agrobacterium group TaxID=227290 RepID=UPI001AEB2E51|nr:ABC transporter substrate-binding protein [Neorhizobium galegae]MBP2551117.1 NitT/TauT family transport system substrate-binding protein [Neorhizobium galegae]
MRVALGVTAIALAAMFAAPAAAEERITFTLNWVTAGEHAAIYWAKHAGWFKEAGIDFVIEQGQGSGVAAQRVGAGASNMGIADLGTAMVAKGAGADLTAVMSVYAKTPYRFYWLASSGIKDLADFPGHKFGNPPGDAARAMWPALAGVNKMDANSIEWVNIAANAKASSMASGAIQGTTYFANYHHVMANAFGDDLRWFDWSDKGLNPYGNSILANGTFLKAHKELVGKAVKILQRAYLHCAEKREECVAILPEYASGLVVKNEQANWNVTVDLMADKFSTTKGLGYFDPDRVAADYKLVSTYFKVAQPFDPATFYSNEFIDPAVRMIAPKQ